MYVRVESHTHTKYTRRSQKHGGISYFRSFSEQFSRWQRELSAGSHLLQLPCPSVLQSNDTFTLHFFFCLNLRSYSSSLKKYVENCVCENIHCFCITFFDLWKGKNTQSIQLSPQSCTICLSNITDLHSDVISLIILL